MEAGADEVVAEDVAVAVTGKVVAPVREEVIESAAATTTTAMSATLATPTVSWEVAARMVTSPCVLRTAKVARTRVVAAEEEVAGGADMAKVTSALAGASLIVTAGTLEGELRAPCLSWDLLGPAECEVLGGMSLIFVARIGSLSIALQILDFSLCSSWFVVSGALSCQHYPRDVCARGICEHGDA